mgnify:CR=1 FL=1
MVFLTLLEDNDMQLQIISTTQEQTRVRIITDDGSDTVKIPNDDRFRFDSDPVLNDEYFLESLREEFGG